jgi:hypothetical protein
MAAFVFQTTALMSQAAQGYAHGLGTTPDYVICEAVMNDATAHPVAVISKNGTMFTTRATADGITVRATAVKIHSIQA